MSLKTASDDWFADFAGTGVPAMAIGRLPARTSADADLMVSKIIGYEQGAGSGSWRRQILLVADTGDDYDFQGEAASFALLVPHSMAVATVLRGTASDGATSSQISGDIENGTLIVDYIGHGSEEVWRGNLLTSDTALTLSNGSMLPFFIDMTCLNALFQDLYMTSLGESLMLAPDGGAVGVWASSGLTDGAPQAIMNRAMLQAMFGGPPRRPWARPSCRPRRRPTTTTSAAPGSCWVIRPPKSASRAALKLQGGSSPRAATL